MKSSKEIEKELAALQSQLSPLNQELDLAVAEFASELPAVVKKWMEGAVSRKVKDHSEKVTAGGITFAKEVKADLSVLYSNLDEICRQAVGPKQNWPHNQTSGSTKTGPSQSRSNESFFSASFRRAINHLGNVLDKHSLLASPSGHVPDWERTSNGHRYATNPGFSEREIAAITRYNTILNNQASLAPKINAKLAELSQAKAAELWDEA